MINSLFNKQTFLGLKQINLFFSRRVLSINFNIKSLINIFYRRQNVGQGLNKIFKNYQFIFNLHNWTHYKFFWDLFYNLKFFIFIILIYNNFFLKKLLHTKMKRAGRARVKFKLNFKLSNYKLKYFYLNTFFKLYLYTTNMRLLDNKLLFFILFMMQSTNKFWHKKKLLLYKSLYDHYSLIVLK